MTTFQTEPAAGANGEPTFAVSGDLDLASAESFIDSATASVGEGTALRLDLSEVTFMDSTGLGALITLRNLMADRGGSLVLVSASSAVSRVLELTGMSDVFSVG